MTSVATQHRDRPVPRREIGPIGTASRVVVGLLAVALPIALEGLNWWDVSAWITLAVFVSAVSRPVLLAFETYGSGAACVLAALLVGAAAGLGIATPAQGDVALWGFLGLSMLLAAARGDGGCEVLAFPNTVMRRRDRVGCIIFTPIDAAEARHHASATRDISRQHEIAPR